MIGSYGPNAEPYEKKVCDIFICYILADTFFNYEFIYYTQFMVEEAPSGMLARGHYEAKVSET